MTTTPASTGESTRAAQVPVSTRAPCWNTRIALKKAAGIYFSLRMLSDTVTVTEEADKPGPPGRCSKEGPCFLLLGAQL